MSLVLTLGLTMHIREVEGGEMENLNPVPMVGVFQGPLVPYVDGSRGWKQPKSPETAAGTYELNIT